MIRFQFSITHVPGKDLTTADALSRAPLTQTTQADEQLTVDSDIYVSAVLQNLPVTDKRLVEIQKAQEQDSVCEAVKQTCRQGWPNQSNLKGVLKKYAPEVIIFQFKKGSYYMMTDLLFQQCFNWRHLLNFILTIRGYTNVNREHMSQYGGQVLVKI